MEGLHTVTHKPYDQERATVDTDVKKQNSSRAGNHTGRPTQHALVNSLLQYLTRPLNRKVDQGIRLGEHDTSTNLSNLRFEDDILLISGSLKHTTTMPDDFTTATEAHGLDLHPRKRKSSPTQHQNQEKVTRLKFKG